MYLHVQYNIRKVYYNFTTFEEKVVKVARTNRTLSLWLKEKCIHFYNYLNWWWRCLYFVLLFRCVIAELFNEGNRLFDLSELLSYRNGDYDPTVTLSNIEDANIRVWVEFITFFSHLKSVEFMYFALTNSLPCSFCKLNLLFGGGSRIFQRGWLVINLVGRFIGVYSQNVAFWELEPNWKNISVEVLV